MTKGSKQKNDRSKHGSILAYGMQNASWFLCSRARKDGIQFSLATVKAYLCRGKLFIDSRNMPEQQASRCK